MYTNFTLQRKGEKATRLSLQSRRFILPLLKRCGRVAQQQHNNNYNGNNNNKI